MYSAGVPGPDDAEDEDDDEDDEDGQEEATDQDPPAVPILRSTVMSGAGMSDDGANATDSDVSPSARRGSSGAYDSNTSKADSSFHTASETFGGDGQSDSVPRSKGQRQNAETGPDPKLGPSNGRLETVPEDPERRSNSVVTDSSALGQASTVNSRASLLPHKDQGNEGGSRTTTNSQQTQSSKSHGAASDLRVSGRDTTDAANTEDPSTEAISPTKSYPAATGLVRFNLPGEAAEDERRTKIRLAQISRRRSLRRARGSRHEGEIIKMEKMLVKVETTVQDLPDDYDENASMSVDTKPVKKWQEYVLVCREGSGQETDFLLQLYKSRVSAFRIHLFHAISWRRSCASMLDMINPTCLLFELGLACVVDGSKRFISSNP